ncbi:hypothetical protein V3C99_000925 [Haemonchus contortus]
MSLCALRKKLSLKKKKEAEMVVEGNSVSKETSPCLVETKPCCLPSEKSGSNGMEEDISQSSELSLASDVPHSHLEKNLPVPNVPSSSCTTCSEEIHAPSPRRTTTPSVDGISTPISIDQFDKVVEIAEIPEIDDDTIELVASDNEIHAGREEFNKTTVAFFGDVLLHVGKKERKKVHARLRTMRISFHDDDTTEVCIAGPFSLLGCELIYREENTITIRLNEKEATKSVVFTAENDADNWMLLLGECWLSEYELLRSSMQEVDVCGTFWLRQGATSEWIYAAAGLNGRTMFYVLLDSADYIYELDVRKILMLRERVDKTDWCPKCKKKDQKGPFLISLEGCALYLECCDDLCTMKWYTAIQDALALTPTLLEDFRLTADNIPILVDKCIRFVAAYGIRSEGIYRRNGKISEAKDIYKRLMEDPVKTHIASSGEETAYAVADVLRQFFRRLKSPLFPPTLHKQIFNLVAARGKADNAIRYQEYRCVLQQMPCLDRHYSQ